LKYEHYCLLQDGFKEWADELKTKEQALKIEILSNLEFFDQKKEEEILREPAETFFDVTDKLITVNKIIKISIYFIF